MWNTAFEVLGSIFSGGAIVMAMSSWLGKVWANRIIEKETAEYKERLERLCKELERKNHVSKVRFDAEFAIYIDSRYQTSRHGSCLICRRGCLCWPARTMPPIWEEYLKRIN